MTTGLDPSYERLARLLLHAFPRRFRALRTDEILSTLAESEAAGRKRPALSTAFDIVAAGLRERRRGHPPLLRWIWYCLGGTLPPEYRGWLIDDLSGWYVLRRTLRFAVPFIAVLAVLSRVMFVVAPNGGMPLAGFAIGTAIGTIPYLFLRGHLRRRVLKQHGLDEEGQPLPTLPVSVPTYCVTEAYRARPLLVAVGIALISSMPFTLMTFFHHGVLGSPLGLGPVTVENPNVDHQWAVGVASLVAAVIVGLISVVWSRSLWTTIERHAASQTTPVVDSDVLTVTVCTAVIVASVGGAFGIVPLVLPAVMLVASGCGPALIAVGLRAKRLERQSGRAIPLPLTRRRMVPAPAQPRQD